MIHYLRTLSSCVKMQADLHASVLRIVWTSGLCRVRFQMLDMWSSLREGRKRSQRWRLSGQPLRNFLVWVLALQNLGLPNTVPIYPSIHPSIHPSIDRSIYLSIYLFNQPQGGLKFFNDSPLPNRLSLLQHPCPVSGFCFGKAMEFLLRFHEPKGSHPRSKCPATGWHHSGRGQGTADRIHQQKSVPNSSNESPRTRSEPVLQNLLHSCRWWKKGCPGMP